MTKKEGHRSQGEDDSGSGEEHPEASRPAVLTMRATEAEAMLLVAALEEQGLEAMVTGELTSGFRAEAPGQVRVLVHEGDLARATEVLKEFDSQGD